MNHKNLDDNALTLSGGEKQRLAFARGFHANPTVWLIDEGTSALDSKTEAELMKNLQQEERKSIKIIIAHRQSLQMYANKQFVVGHSGKGSET